jgi:hypothetical protein
MSKALLILFAVALVLQTDIGCRPVHASLVIEAPCCGPKCPLSAAGGAIACCQCAGAGSARHTADGTAPISPTAGMAPAPGASWLPSGTITRGARGCVVEELRAPENPLAMLCLRQI